MKELIKDILIALVFVFITMQFVEITQVVGISMEPNFQDGQYLIVSRESYAGSEPQRGDVIVFESSIADSNGGYEKLIKRVIGLPGETVEIKDSRVYIDGVEQNDSYTNDKSTNGNMKVKVPADCYFCMGDNRLRSLDSRSDEVGLVRKEDIDGKVVFRIYPFSEAGRIPLVM